MGRPFDADKKEAEEKLKFEAQLKTMRERERRAVLREIQGKDSETDSESLDERTKERQQKAKVKTTEEKKEWTYEEYNSEDDIGPCSDEDETASDSDGVDVPTKTAIRGTEDNESGDEGEDEEDEEDEEEDEDENDWLAQASGVPKERESEEKGPSKDCPAEITSGDKDSMPEAPNTTSAPSVQATSPSHVATEETLRGVVKGFRFGS
jgi:hypothetical protein